jgi:PTS system nitrogen regulatory IIA component
MELANILIKGSIITCAKVSSKRQLLQKFADEIANDIDVPAATIFNTLIAREQLGSTGLGNGIAIPHGKLDGINGVKAVFARLEQPIDFDSVDEMPIDLAIMLIAPTGAGADHLKALAKVARLLRSESVVKRLRETRDIDKLHEILTAPLENTNAA